VGNHATTKWISQPSALRVGILSSLAVDNPDAVESQHANATKRAPHGDKIGALHMLPAAVLDLSNEVGDGVWVAGGMCREGEEVYLAEQSLCGMSRRKKWTVYCSRKWDQQR
jgi:hypothetical protein